MYCSGGTSTAGANDQAVPEGLTVCMSEYDDGFKTSPLPPPEGRISDANNIYGPGFHAFRRPGGFSLMWDGGDIAGQDVEAEISEEELNSLRSDPDSFIEIVHRKYNEGEVGPPRGR